MKKLLAMLLAVVMVLSLAACGSGKTAADTPAADAPAASGAVSTGDGKTTVHVALSGSVTEVAPYAATNEYAEPIRNTVFETLFVKPTVSSTETIPVIGKSWEMVDDYTARVEIFDYVHDVDGNPITASDVVYSYQACAESGTQTDTAYIDSMNVVDDYTFEIKLTEVSQPTMLKLLTHIVIVNEEAHKANPDLAIGTSPYKLTAYTAGAEYVCEKTGSYWQTDESLISPYSQANVDKLVFEVITEAAQVTNALENHERNGMNMRKLMVGAAKACINPTPDMYPIPSSFADWGVAPLLQSEIYDDMYCRAIVIDNGSEKLLMLSYELANYPAAPGLVEKLTEITGIPAENIFISATHNHSAPKDNHSENKNNSPAEIAFHEKYWEIELSAAMEAVNKAISGMRPARYGYGEGSSYANVNRDVRTPPGFWLEGKNLEGYSDKTVRTLKFVDEEEKVIAVILNYGMHNTCIHMMKDFDGKSKTSGNVSGIACRFVEETYGNGAIALWTSGAAGNQNPLLSHNLQYEYPDGYSTCVHFPDGIGYMLMEYMGRWHGVDCVKSINAINTYSDNMPIRTVHKDVLLPGQKRAVKPTKFAMFRMGGNGLRQSGDVPVLPETPEMVPADPVNLEMRLAVLGDVAMICAGAELYAEIGRDMLEAVPYKKAFLVTHTALHQAGYILDKTSKDKKVFQSFMDVKPGSADGLIVNNALELFELAK